MKQTLSSLNSTQALRYLLKWVLLCIPVSLVTGSLVALFLWLLDAATVLRWQQGWLLFLLPLAGIGIHFVHQFMGKASAAGNNLIIDEIHQPAKGVPAGMAPLILATTVATHLFGGSAGREGTAVQIGGSMAQMLGKWLKLDKEDMRTILIAGMAAGFGAVFGTPVAGAVFALEVLAIGSMRYHALLPCLLAAFFSHVVCTAWGIHHTAYAIAYHSPAGMVGVQAGLVGKIVLASVAFGLVAYAFATLTHGIKHTANTLIPHHKWLIPAIGGTLLIAGTYALGTRDYLGLGVTSASPDGVSIVSAFKPSGVAYSGWFWKLLFTAVTLGTGFKGGEVTPLFFIGAALGNTLAAITGAPPDLFAALGFLAVFAGATNTPIACTLMGVELFGAEHVLYFAIACTLAYCFSGHSGIYTAQRTEVGKPGRG